jgi:hypothetical protein
MDLTALAPILVQAGAPLIGKLLTTAATAVGGPLAGSVTGLVVDKVVSELGAASSSPADVTAAIKADPAKAKEVLQQVEEDHSDVITDLLAKAADANAEAAKSVSWFVAGARPAALWVATAGLAYEVIARPLLGWLCGFAHLAGPPALPPEVFNVNMNVLLGLAGVRMFEAFGGVARESLQVPRGPGVLAGLAKRKG